MSEKIPKPPAKIPEDETRRAAIAELDRVHQDVAAWCRDDPGCRSRAALLDGAIADYADTESVERITGWLRYFLDNEAVRRDFDFGRHN